MSEANFNVPFLPQTGISQQILEAMAQSNLQKQQATQNQIAQQNADTEAAAQATRQQLANQGAPLSSAQALEEQSRAQQAQAALQLQQNILNGLNPNHSSAQAPLSEPHIAAVVGNQGVSNPTPAASAASPSIDSAVPPAIAAASIPNVGGSQPAPPATTPTPGVSSFQAHENEVGKRIGGFTDSEQQDIDLNREALQYNPTMAGLQEYQKNIAAIVQKRGDPDYAQQVAFQKQGMSLPDAKLAVVRNKGTDAALTAFETDPTDLSGDKVAGSIAQLKTLAARPDLTPVNQERATRALATAENAQQIAMNQKQQEKKQEQAITQGSPTTAAQLLVDGNATLSQLKARGSTPDFIVNTLSEANKLSGGSYNAQAAEAQYDTAKSPASLAFFGSAKSLTDKGGTLDQLKAAGDAIPDGKIPIFNSIADAQKAATGSGPIAKYAAIALGVADDSSKVQGNGAGSDSSREQALKLIPTNASSAARQGAIDGIRSSVNSQITSRIGSNKILQQMYGSSSGLKTPSTPNVPSTVGQHGFS